MDSRFKAAICSVTAILGIAAGLPEIQNAHISREGLALVAQAEGCRREPYRCSANVWTTGVGHTTNVRPGNQPLSDEQIAHHFISDVLTAEKAVTLCIKKPLTQFQYDAFVSLAFNIGGPAFCRSSLVREANTGNISAACQELSRWVYANGRQNTGLKTRRQNELRYCMRKE